MDAIEFVTKWNAIPGGDLSRFPREALQAYGLAEDTVGFLSNAGLPSSAAPFLDFGIPRSGRLQTVAETWHLDASFNHWVNIGNNGSGDPIAIDTKDHQGAIYYLNHDNGFTPRLIASSVQQLAKLLLSFRELVIQTVALGGADAFLENRIPTELVAAFLSDLSTIDPAAAANSMWLDELPRDQH